MARLLAALLITAVSTAPAIAQIGLRPAFTVATIKKNSSGDASQSMRLQPGGRILATNQPLRRLIVFAYGLQPQQLAGGPSWLDTDRFDVVAQADRALSPTPPGGPPGQAQLMMQRLLEERFGLSVHVEAREMPVYALTLARSDGRLGPRIKTGGPRLPGADDRRAWRCTGGVAAAGGWASGVRRSARRRRAHPGRRRRHANGRCAVAHGAGRSSRDRPNRSRGRLRFRSRVRAGYLGLRWRSYTTRPGNCGYRSSIPLHRARRTARSQTSAHARADRRHGHRPCQSADRQLAHVTRNRS